MTFNHFMRTL